MGFSYGVEVFPGELIRSAAAKMTDRLLWTCVRTAPYPAFLNRWSLPPRSHAAAPAIAYPYCHRARYRINAWLNRWSSITSAATISKITTINQKTT